MLEELEDMLIQADMGVETALRVTANMAEANSGTITLAETEPVAFKEFLRFLYTDAVPAAALRAMPDHLLDLGKKYGVARLVALCERALVASLGVEMRLLAPPLSARTSRRTASWEPQTPSCPR